MFEVSENGISRKNQSHLVLICDETGIFDAFRTVKEQLGTSEEVFLSLIYSFPDDYINPLFEREIAILEKRFSHNLYTYILKTEPRRLDYIQVSIEAIINSNTSLLMQFLVFGKEEFTDFVSGVLEYLDIDTFSIESKSNHSN